MRWRVPAPRFGLRTLLLLVLAAAIGLGLWTAGPRWRMLRNQQARQRIDLYELKIAGEGDPRAVPPELVAILGDSRLQHWQKALSVALLDGEKLASWSRNGRVRIWDINTGKQEQVFEGQSMALSGDRKSLYFALDDGTIVRWDGKKREELFTFPPPLDRHGIGLYATRNDSFLLMDSGSSDGRRMIRVVDLETREVKHEIPSPAGIGVAALLTNDGSTLCWNDTTEIHVIDTTTGMLSRKLGPIRKHADDGPCLLGKLVLSKDEKTLYVGSALSAVVALDFESGKELRRIGPGAGSIHQFALEPSERSIAWGEDRLTVHSLVGGLGEGYSMDRMHPNGGNGDIDWLDAVLVSIPSDQPLKLWRTSEYVPRRLLGGQPAGLTSLAFHPAGTWLVGGNQLGEMVFWEIGTWSELRRIRAHDERILGLRVSDNGKVLATRSSDGNIVTWDADTLEEMAIRRDFFPHNRFGISPDGSTLSSHFRNDVVTLWTAETAKDTMHMGPIKFTVETPPVWSPDGKLVACVDSSSNVLLFDVATGKALGSHGKMPFTGQELHIAWLSDNKRMVTANWGRDEVHVLEVGKTKPVQTINSGVGRVLWAAVHPTEEWIAVCGSEMPVQLWHLPTSKLVKSWQIGPPKGEVKEVHFSPDGHYLVTLNGNGTAYVLSLGGVLP